MVIFFLCFKKLLFLFLFYLERCDRVSSFFHLIFFQEKNYETKNLYNSQLSRTIHMSFTDSKGYTLSCKFSTAVVAWCKCFFKNVNYLKMKDERLQSLHKQQYINKNCRHQRCFFFAIFSLKNHLKSKFEGIYGALFTNEMLKDAELTKFHLGKNFVFDYFLFSPNVNTYNN